MRSNELRVGNYLDFDGKLSLVKEIDEQGVVVFIKETEETEWIDLFQFTPIPLKEEILLKCGFERIEVSHEEYYNVSYEKQISSDVFVSYEDDFSCSLFGTKEDSINSYGVLPNWHSTDSVHGLQNLHFILTGEELEINL